MASHSIPRQEARAEVELKPFAAEEVPRLIDLWNEVVYTDGSEERYGCMTPERFKNRVLDNPNFAPEGAILAYSQGRLVGFCLVATRREPSPVIDIATLPGYLSALLVHPQHRRRGIGSALLQAGIGYLRRQGKRQIRTGYRNPIPLFVGIEVEDTAALSFFRAQGFEEEIEWRMRLSLAGFAKDREMEELRRRLGAEGVEVHPLQEQEVEDLLALLQAHFAGWYEPMYNDAHRGTLELSNLFVARRGEALVGFVRVGWSGDTGGVWGIGVAPEKRNKGVGTWLLFAALNRLKRAGVETVNLSTGATNFAAQRIYGKAGFQKVGAFAIFRKPIG
ncbi:MAG TPA: GNAT family N-acetyltransferase [Armatimonadetes bacterium]|nr:GNAT family N-acetyltransferase [Armatimonadota bacterium]